MSRKESREKLFQLIFEYCFNNEKNEETLNEIIKNCDSDDATYINAVYNGVVDNYDELSKKIAQNSNGFVLERIFKVDLAIMLLASYEFLYYNLPPAVAINEAVNLAKKYSTQKSATFVNGVLASLVKK